MTILVVDDAEDIVTSSHLIRARGLSGHLRRNRREEALELLSKQREPDLVILDHMLRECKASRPAGRPHSRDPGVSDFANAYTER